MHVVSDTSPLSNLAIIDRLELAWEQFGVIWVPEAVSGELERLRHRGGQEELVKARLTGRLQIGQIQNQTAAELLAGHLESWRG